MTVLNCTTTNPSRESIRRLISKQTTKVNSKEQSLPVYPIQNLTLTKITINPLRQVFVDFNERQLRVEYSIQGNFGQDGLRLSGRKLFIFASFLKHTDGKELKELDTLKVSQKRCL